MNADRRLLSRGFSKALPFEFTELPYENKRGGQEGVIFAQYSLPFHVIDRKNAFLSRTKTSIRHSRTLRQSQKDPRESYTVVVLLFNCLFSPS